METWGEKEMWGVRKEIFNNFNQNVSLTSVLVQKFSSGIFLFPPLTYLFNPKNPILPLEKLVRILQTELLVVRKIETELLYLWIL
jgi:hypothetical protein